MWQLFRDVGFGSPLQLGFPGETSGRVRPWKNWRPIDQATMSYGHGIAVSLVQLAHAYLMFARDGEVIPLSLVRQGGAPIPGKQVIAAKTAQDVRAMLELAVSPEGTAPLAQIMGYRVGGKTGTAHKPGPQGAGYAGDRYISSFSGLAPASSPRLIVAVMIDEPHGGAYYGGTVAGPVFATVMGGSLRLLGVPTDAPMKPLKLPGIDQVIEEGV
jgi:cell division protein FtsI (penicillin-binding protein 3)